MDPEEHLRRMLDAMREYVPWVYERCTDVELTDARATLHGGYTPTVRHPVGQLPGGGIVLGMADVVVANDPITGQGSNTAAKCAADLPGPILARGDQPFDEAWMRDDVRGVLARTPAAGHRLDQRDAAAAAAARAADPRTAAANQAVARRFANGFADPSDFQHWLMDPAKADAYLAEVAADPTPA